MKTLDRVQVYQNEKNTHKKIISLSDRLDDFRYKNFGTFIENLEDFLGTQVVSSNFQDIIEKSPIAHIKGHEEEIGHYLFFGGTKSAMEYKAYLEENKIPNYHKLVMLLTNYSDLNLYFQAEVCFDEVSDKNRNLIDYQIVVGHAYLGSLVSYIKSNFEQILSIEMAEYPNQWGRYQRESNWRVASKS